MTQSAPAAILFDLDGTLIDTYHLYLECYRRALEPHLGYAPSAEEIGSHNPASEKRFLTDWLGALAGEECHARVRQLYGELHMSWWDGDYEGVAEMITALRAAGYPLGIVTGKGREAWEVTRGYSDLGPFEVVITDDDVPAGKPDPSGLLAACTALSIAPDRAVYIGDSMNDLRAGRNAGMPIGAAVWAKTGPGERDAFLQAAEELAPYWVFERPADITRAFAARC